MIIKSLVKGILSYIPGVLEYSHHNRNKMRHSCADSHYSYNLWLTIFLFLKENNVNPHFDTIAELGTGGSLGVASCFLLLGVKQFYALEVEDEFDLDKNLKIYDELVNLLRIQSPATSKYKNLNFRLIDSAYPEELKNLEILKSENIESVRKSLLSIGQSDNRIKIIYDWHNKEKISLDFIYSRAVMEHVDNPPEVHLKLYNTLNEGGYILHDIELHSHGITKQPHGHLKINKFVWKLIKGKRKYSLNRFTMEDHLDAMKNCGFKIISQNPVYLENYSKHAYGVVILAMK